MENSKFIYNFDRPNLYYEVRKKGSTTSCISNILAFIKLHVNESGIIYCQSRKDCEKLCDELSLHLGNNSITYYHAGIESNSDRSKRAKAWAKGEIKIIIATVAFGMGINKVSIIIIQYVCYYLFYNVLHFIIR